MVMPSLLPYINPGKAISRLDISRTPHQTTPGGALRFPFAIISESGPFTRIIQARIESDHGSIIKRVFLLLDKDTYPQANNESTGLNNELVEQCWQEAYERCSLGSSAILLADQVGEDGRIQQFQPLFYCRSREIFFHPPCPHCGTSLALCKDDDLLISCGLQAYPSSLRRYLYCPDCLQNKGRTDFYASALDHTDPQCIKDPHQLITGFGSLDEAESDQFPCTRCPLKGECYDQRNLALTRIIPFSFYPFHLLILESASINAFDFLAVLCGASFGELRDRLNATRQFGRIPSVDAVALQAAQATPFLFDKDQRSFLEILYLKLSFLGQLARIVFSGITSCRNTPFNICLDRVWISLTHEENLLPFFWNFQANLIDIGGVPLKHLPSAPPLAANYFLGTVWFHGLLGNQALKAGDIPAVLATGLTRTDALTATFTETSVMEEYSHLFSPENIFWTPKGKSVPEKWSGLWRDALGLGWALLKSSVSDESRLSEGDFWKAFDKLRGEIRNTLFQPGSESAAEKAGPPANDAIHEILGQILSRWSAQPEAGEEEFAETVVLTGGAPEPAQPEPAIANEPEETLILQATDTDPGTRCGDEEDVLETVILSSDEVRVEPPRKIDDIITETIMMQSGQHVPGTGEPEEPAPDAGSHVTPGGLEEDLDETVILNPESGTDPVNTRAGGNDLNSGESEQPSPPHKHEGPQDPARDVDLAETVILHSDAGDQTVIMNPNLPKSEPSDTPDRGDMGGSADEEDFLAETIILKPDKG